MDNKHKKSTEKQIILYGKHAVFAALNNPRRKIVKILCTVDNLQNIKETCAKMHIAESFIEVCDKKRIESILPPASVHQGVALISLPLEDYSIEEICTICENEKNTRVLILDQVTDPQNIGAIIRSCAAFGVKALIMQNRNSPQENAVIAKTSVGMSEILPIVRVTNLSRAVETLKKNEFWVLGMDGYAKDYISSVDKSGKLAVIMGSEGKGMRRLIEESCDITAKIPMEPEVESLNVSNAAAIILYELYK